jgi:glycine hydroxymethyltransferase
MLARRLISKTFVPICTRAATTESLAAARAMNRPLKETDPELFNIIEGEKIRLRDCLNLIASENMTSKSVYDALGSVMNNKYSEGSLFLH